VSGAARQEFSCVPHRGERRPTDPRQTQTLILVCFPPFRASPPMLVACPGSSPFLVRSQPPNFRVLFSLTNQPHLFFFFSSSFSSSSSLSTLLLLHSFNPSSNSSPTHAGLAVLTQTYSSFLEPSSPPTTTTTPPLPHILTHPHTRNQFTPRKVSPHTESS
jgi:hypothetical protein